MPLENPSTVLKVDSVGSTGVVGALPFAREALDVGVHNAVSVKPSYA